MLHTITVISVNTYLKVVSKLHFTNKMFTILTSNLQNCSNSNITVIFTYNKHIINFLVNNKINYTTTSTILNVTTVNSVYFN